MTNVVVFGARGYLGGHVVDALVGDPRVSLLVTPRRSECDLIHSDHPAVVQLLAAAKADVVVTCVGRLDGNAEELLSANTMTTAKLLDACRRTGTKIVRIGSAGEYGATPPGVPVREDGPVDPVGTYGLSHLMATRLLEQARARGEVDAVTLRVFNPIGPGMHDITVLGRALRLLARAKDCETDMLRLGSLSAYRDFVDARDVGSAVAAAVFSRTTVSTINVGSGRAVTVREAVRILAEVAGFTGEIKETSAPPSRSQGVDWIQADISAATSHLGWAPAYDLRRSLEHLWSRSDRHGGLVAG